MDIDAGTGRDDLERDIRQGKPVDEEMVVCGHLRADGRIHHHDRKRSWPRHVSLLAVHAEGENGIHRHQCLVLSGGESTENTFAGLCVEQYHLEFASVEPIDVASNWCRGGDWGKHCKTTARKGVPSFYTSGDDIICYPNDYLIWTSVWSYRNKYGRTSPEWIHRGSTSLQKWHA